jgi:hypothetical protein
MMDVKDAVKVAENYMDSLYSDSVRGLLLEEVELSDDEQFWCVTLSWDVDILGTQRTYKVFKIRANDGTVVSMKMRTLQ